MPQLVQISKDVGGGKYNVSAAAEVRFQRFQDSVKNNPTFNFANPRFATAFAETVFPLAFFIDGRVTDQELALDLDSMRGFFQNSRMPRDFWRRGVPLGLTGPGADAAAATFAFVQTAHDYFPGFNNGTGKFCASFPATFSPYRRSEQLCCGS